ncbi:LuxR C-terminal-related transcriptional regulator, partial [Escherichia coli]|uniref:LuxR C-terminal-related transcriptional regulator n=1 Tax=Escherichia coli TaxID=562 RepID=UPI003D354309
ARNGGKNSLNRLIRCVCGKKIGPDPRNFNQRVNLGRNDLLIRTFPNGFVSKCNDQNDIFHAVQMILSGYTFFPSETLNYIKSNKCSTNSSTITVLSNREVTILRYLVSGLSNKEIADKLLLSNKTVSAHKSNIYGKLGLHSIVELIDYAKLYELI